LSAKARKVGELLNEMARCHIVVLGDLMLDEYLWGEITRISPEAPVPVMHLDHREILLGGAANVARNLVSLGARATVIGVVGADLAGQSLFEQLDMLGIERAGVPIDPVRSTTRKCRFMSIEHNQQVFRYDEETADEISIAAENEILESLRARIPTAHAIICSDYLKGVLTQRVLQETAAIARLNRVPLVTAPKDNQPQKYASASVLMPNLREFGRLVGHRKNGDTTSWIAPAARFLLERFQWEAILVTRGRDGMTLFERSDGEPLREDIRAVSRNVYDVTGAGDTSISVFTLSVAAGAARVDAARLANLAAGIAVGKRGTACVAKEEILERLGDVASAVSGATRTDSLGANEVLKRTQERRVRKGQTRISGLRT